MVHCWVFLFFPLSSFLSRPPSSHPCSPSPFSLLSLSAALALPPLSTLFMAGEMGGGKQAGPLQKQRKRYIMVENTFSRQSQACFQPGIPSTCPNLRITMVLTIPTHTPAKDTHGCKAAARLLPVHCTCQGRGSRRQVCF